MALILPQNPYQGINPPLHSYFQAEGGWSSFHTGFIAALARTLNSQLPAGFLDDDVFVSLSACTRRADYAAPPLNLARYSQARLAALPAEGQGDV
ncbi:MAG: hypothetical protein HC915_09525 [Anaerolineae bacterium]|nr:hypothetical protein [Anaerolineae bacterium]